MCRTGPLAGRATRDDLVAGHREQSRVSFARIKPDECTSSCVEFLRKAVAYYAGLGVRIDKLMTDNGTGCKKIFDAACQELGIRHVRNRPYAPKTNGKAERFVQGSNQPFQ
jgi:transposase InsO family protein